MKAVALLVLALLLASCSRVSFPGAGTLKPAAPDVLGSWILQHGRAPSGAIEGPGGAHVTIVFDADGVHGQACNVYGGKYQLDGSHVSFSEMSMTEMACQEPMMTVESRYHEALAAVTTAARSGDTLTLSGPGAELVFSLQPPVSDAGMENTYWSLETLIQGETASSVLGNAWLQLQGGELKGATGCHDLAGGYALADGRLTVTGLRATGSCDAELADQDALVMRVLGGGPAYAIDGRSLTLSLPDGSGLGYLAPGED